MEQGKVEKAILEQVRRNKVAVPDRIKNAPILEQGLEFYYSAFLDLTTCRAVGFGEGPIPWSATHEYARMKGLSSEEETRFTALIKAMDVAYLDYRSKQKPGN